VEVFRPSEYGLVSNVNTRIRFLVFSSVVDPRLYLLIPSRGVLALKVPDQVIVARSHAAEPPTSPLFADVAHNPNGGSK